MRKRIVMVSNIETPEDVTAIINYHVSENYPSNPIYYYRDVLAFRNYDKDTSTYLEPTDNKVQRDIQQGKQYWIEEFDEIQLSNGSGYERILTRLLTNKSYSTLDIDELFSITHGVRKREDGKFELCETHPAMDNVGWENNYSFYQDLHAEQNLVKRNGYKFHYNWPITLASNNHPDLPSFRYIEKFILVPHELQLK